MRVVIIDTGIDKNYIDERIVGGITITEGKTGYGVMEGYDDLIGHGTGTADVILKNTKKAELFEVRVYDEELFISADKLTYALEYINANLEFDLIQISSGVPAYSYELHNVIKKIVDEKKVSIISAFDNEGAMSYPAALKEVIGVDVAEGYADKKEFDVIDNNIIDLRGNNAYYRVPWGNGKRNIVKGSSFLVSCFTAMIAELEPEDYTKKSIMEQLKKRARKVYGNTEENGITAKQFVDGIEKAIIFPFNKEIHSIAAYEDMLSFEVKAYYDIKHKFLIGKKVCEVLKYTENTHVIENYENIEWDGDFDTVILGHVGEINKILKRNLLAEIIEKCLSHNKRLYLFDDLSFYTKDYINTEKVYCPMIKDNRDLMYNGGKLRVTNKPVLAVMGTSSKQGKFTIQLEVMRELKKRGVNVDGIGSEPTSVFFGYSQMFPFGYGSNNTCSARTIVRLLNDMVWELESKDVDLILTGCQSGTIAYDLRNERLLPVEQYHYLLGTNPDGVILCVNEIDEIEYVRRTINFIESAVTAKVIAIVLSETHNMHSYSVLGNEMLVEERLSVECLEKEFGRPVFSLFSLNVELLGKVILEYYS